MAEGTRNLPNQQEEHKPTIQKPITQDEEQKLTNTAEVKPITEDEEQQLTTEDDYLGSNKDYIYMNEDQNLPGQHPSGGMGEDIYIWMDGERSTAKNQEFSAAGESEKREVANTPNDTNISYHEYSYIESKDGVPDDVPYRTDIYHDYCSIEGVPDDVPIYSSINACQETPPYYNVTASTEATAELPAEEVVYDDTSERWGVQLVEDSTVADTADHNYVNMHEEMTGEYMNIS